MQEFTLTETNSLTLESARQEEKSVSELLPNFIRAASNKEEEFKSPSIPSKTGKKSVLKPRKRTWKKTTIPSKTNLQLNGFLAFQFLNRLKDTVADDLMGFHRILSKIVDCGYQKMDGSESIQELMGEFMNSIPQKAQAQRLSAHFIHLLTPKESLKFGFSLEATLVQKIRFLIRQIGLENPSFLTKLAAFDVQEGIEGFKKITDQIFNPKSAVSELNFILGVGDCLPASFNSDFMDLTDQKNDVLDEKTMKRRLTTSMFDSTLNFTLSQSKSLPKRLKKGINGCVSHSNRQPHCLACVIHIVRNQLFWMWNDNSITPVSVKYSNTAKR